MHLRRSPLAAWLFALLLTGALLTGCGSSTSGNGVASKTPAEIVAGAKILADAANSVHVYGSLQSGGSPTSFDLYLLTSKGGRGQLSADGRSFEVIQIHGNVYIKGSPAFYSHIAGPSAAQLLQGRWLQAPAGTGSLASIASLTNLAKLVDTTLPAHGTLSKGAATTVAGQKVIAVTDTSTGGTLYVATTGPPYPVEITMGGAGGGSISFSGWNQPLSITKPPNPIDITQLQSRH
jgi:hypothetical protein